MRNGTFRGVATAGMAVMMVALALAGCAQGAAHGATATPSTDARATTAAPAALAWRAVALPPGVELASETSGASYVISPVDGRDAWLCAPLAAGGFAIWSTGDAGANWRRVGTLALSMPEPPMCTLVADQMDPRTLGAVLMYGSGEAGTLHSVSALSGDGGASWHAVPGDTQLAEVATTGGTTYAIVRNITGGTAGAGGGPPGIAISADGLRTWRDARPSGLAANDSFFQFWLNPATREMLAASGANTLWRSGDGGASWTRLHTPDMQVTLGVWLAAARQWRLCGGAQTPALTILCSVDLGATWTPQPALTATLQCASCGKWGAPVNDTQPCPPSAIAADGALLADCPTNGSAPGSGETTLWRLAPGAAAWATLGITPGPWLIAAASGPLWCWDTQHATLAVTPASGL